MKKVLTKILPPKIFRVAWYLSVLIFLSFFYFHNTTNQELAATAPLITLFLISIPAGIVFFLVYLVSSKRKIKPLIECAIAAILVVVGPLAVVNVRGSKIVHDGTRTGPRVSYQSYCNPTGGYVIYENEKIQFTKVDGEVVYWTKYDFECYKKDIAEGKTEESSKLANQDPIVDCRISKECGGGSKELKSSLCDKMTCCLLDEGSKFLTKYQCDHYYDTAINPTPITTASNFSSDCYFEGKVYKSSSNQTCQKAINEILEVRRLTSELERINNDGFTFSYPVWDNDTSEGEQISQEIKNIDTTIDPWNPPFLEDTSPTPICYPVIVGGNQGVVCP